MLSRSMPRPRATHPAATHPAAATPDAAHSTARDLTEARLTEARLAAIGSLAGLAVLKLVMLAALFTRTEPYPPLQLAPLFAASLALSALAVALICANSRRFLAPTVLVVLESLLSVGPHKLYPGESAMFAQTAAVYPVILVGSALILILLVTSRALFAALRASPPTDPISMAAVARER